MAENRTTARKRVDAETYLPLFRVFVYAGALLRFYLHKGDDVAFAEGLVVGSAGLLFALLALIRPSPSPARRQALVYADVLVVSFLYAFTHTLESDFFLFYYLAIVCAAEHFEPRQIWRAGTWAGVGLAGVVAYLAWSEPVSLRHVLVSVLLPREFFLLLVVTISSGLVRIRSALPDSLAEIVRATRSASTLDRKLDALLDELMALGFEQVGIGLVDDWMDTVQLVRGRNLPPRQLLLARFPLDGPDIMADIVRFGRVEVFPAGQNDPRFDPLIYETFDHKHLARIFAPLVSSAPGAKVVGTIECGSTGPDGTELVERQQNAVARLAAKYADVLAANRTHVLLSSLAQQAIDIIGADSATIHVYQGNDVLYQAGAGQADNGFLQDLPPRKSGFVSTAISDRVPIPVSRAELRAKHPDLFAAGVGAMAVFPMLELGHPDTHGLLYVHFWRAKRFVPRAIERFPLMTPWSFRPRTMEIGALFAAQIQAVIQNYLTLRHASETAERTWQVSVLQNFIQSLASKHDSGSLLKEIARRVLLYLPESDCVTLYQYVESEKLFQFPPVMAGHFFVVSEMKTQVHREEAEWLLEIESSRYLRNVTERDDLARPHRDEARRRFVDREKIVSSAQLPLRNQDGELVGILFINYRREHDFDDAERKAIDAFASAAAIAIANARSLHEERRRTVQIQQLQQTLGEIEAPFRAEAVAKQILEQVREVLDFPSGSVQLLQGDHRLMLAAVGVDPQTASQYLVRPISEDRFTRAVLAKKKPTVVHDTFAVANWPMPDVRSWIGIPLHASTGVIGLIAIDGATEHAFRHANVDALELLAGQAGPGLQRAIEFDDAHRKIQHLELLQEVSATIDTHPPAKDLVQAIAERVVAKMRCDQCNVFLKDGNWPNRVLKADGTKSVFPSPSREPYSLDIPGRESAPVMMAFKDGQDLLIDSTDKILGTLPSGVATDRRAKARSMIVMPIAAGDHKFGVITAEKNSTAFFREADALVMKEIARSTGNAIERERGFKLIQEVGAQILKSKGVVEILQTIVSGVVSLTDVDTAAIFFRNQTGVDPNYEKVTYPEQDLPDPRPGGLTMQIEGHGRVIFVENLADLKHDVSDRIRRDYRSLIGIPLQTGAKTEGALFLFSKTRRVFTESERSLLQSLVNQAALVVKKTHRLERTEGRLAAIELREAALKGLVELNDLCSVLFHDILGPIDDIALLVTLIDERFQEIRQGLDDVRESAKAGVGARELASKIHDALAPYTLAAKHFQDIKERLGRIREMVKRVKESVDGVSATAGGMRRVQVTALINRICDTVLAKLSSEQRVAKLVRDLGPPSLEIEVYEGLVGGALKNIVANAFDAVQGRPNPQVRIAVTSSQDGDVKISIEDKGVGIHPDDIPHIFKLSYTKGKSGAGGYGLWFSKAVFDAAGIDVNVSSTPGEGTTFSLEVPASQKEEDELR